MAWAAALTLAQAQGGSALAAPEAELAVYAAGSLRSAMTDLARAFEREGASKIRLVFGASGLLKDRILAGEDAQVFASANMTHPQALQDAGRAEAVVPFARNSMCALASGGFDLQGEPIVQRLLDADVRVGTSTPLADPSGDYAFQLFELIETTGLGGAGSTAALKAKALQLTGGPTSPKPPAGRSLYGTLVDEGKADVFITYCTNAVAAKHEFPTQQVLQVPDEVNVSARYGIAAVVPVQASARAFVEFVTGERGLQILRSHGFGAP